jgi:molecular chaperone GrpE (heat shock protein)
MKIHAKIVLLLLSSTLLLPKLALCWDDDNSYRSQANPNGFNNYTESRSSFDNYRPHSNSARDSYNYDSHERHERHERKHEREETPQEQYQRAKFEQQAEVLRLQAEYEQVKNRMQAEYLLESLKK